MRERVLDQVWESGHVVARVVRALLIPPSWVFGGIVRLRNRAYDRGWIAQQPLSLPMISIGNLTVGGTGKTPVTAWIASRLRERGGAPCVVLRGYGGDEPLVHRRLNPDVPVVVDADRVGAIARMRDAGATVAVLDDGFQHRRARRDADVVLLSADRFGPVRLLPAGPWREPLTALGRASMIIVTRKSASRIRARELLSHALRFAPRAEAAMVHLAAEALVACDSNASLATGALADADVLAISSIGEPRAFESQLRALGARVVSASYPDHHHFTAHDATSLAERALGVQWAVCTLKDAVKLSALWPRGASRLWYLSQRVSVEAGAESLDALIARFAPRVTP
jgi:tetraacyldisaccharide 4'-kinase